MNDYSLYGLSYVLADYSFRWNYINDYINDFSPPYGLLPVPLDYMNNFLLYEFKIMICVNVHLKGDYIYRSGNGF